MHEGFDPLSPEFLADPYAVLAELPDDEPVFYAPSLDYYVVTRYADVEQVFLDPKTYSAATAQLPLIQLEPEALKILAEGGHRPQPSMVSLDPPAHTRLRRPASRAFTPRRVAAMEERIHATVDELLDAVDDSQPFDLVSALTFPLPATIVFSFMGVPEAGLGAAEDVVRLTRHARLGPPRARGAGRPRAQHGRLPRLPARARQEQGRRSRRRLRERAAGDPRRGSGGAQPRGDRLDPVLALVRRPRDDELPDRQPDPAAARRAIALGGGGRRPRPDPGRGRRDAALRHLGAGVAADHHAPVTLGGVDLPEGAKLFLWLAASGRDGDVFPEPDRFDPARENAHHNLAFGKGIHYCAGATLGKLEARLALGGLIERWPELRLVEDQTIPFHPNISFRGPLELWATAA